MSNKNKYLTAQNAFHSLKTAMLFECYQTQTILYDVPVDFSYWFPYKLLLEWVMDLPMNEMRSETIEQVKIIVRKVKNLLLWKGCYPIEQFRYLDGIDFVRAMFDRHVH